MNLERFFEIVSKIAIKIAKTRISADNIIHVLALANSARLGWVYAYADAQGNVFSLPGIAGVSIGLAISFAVAFVTSKISTLHGLRQILAWVSLGFIMVLEPLVIAPVTRVGMPKELVDVTGWYAWFWAVFTALLPSMVIAAVSFVNGEGLIATSRAEKRSSVADSETSEKQQSNSSAKEERIPLKCPVCGESKNKRGEFMYTKNSLNGHMREHKIKA